MLGELIALVVPLGLDTLAVSAALGAAGLPPARRNRLSALMAGFEAGMPLVGLGIGTPLSHAIGSGADYVAAGILLAVGLLALREGGERDDEASTVARLSDLAGWSAILLGLSISLDELAIGFTLGLLKLPVALVIACIAGQALLLSQLGMRLGSRFSEGRRELAERVAGLALIGIGIAVVAGRLG